jgi:hypothetical protein
MKHILKSLLMIFVLSLHSLAFSQKFGNALEFDGLDDWVYVGNDTSLQVDQFTLTSWVYPYSYSEPIPKEQRMEIMEKAGEFWMNISTTDAGYMRDMGEVRVGGIFEGQWHFLDSEFVVPLNEWTHVSCTYDYDSMIVYINGEYDIAKAIPENHTDHLLTDNVLALGCKSLSGPTAPIEAQFHGMLDELSIWNTSLEVEEIRNIMRAGISEIHPKWNKLRAYYKLDENSLGESSGTVVDAFFKNNGVNYGATWVSNTMVSIGQDIKHQSNMHLQQNYPNPFISETYIPFQLNDNAHVQIDIYNITGKFVSQVLDESYPAGKHSVKWNAASYPRGVYFIRLSTEGHTETMKCVLN